MVTLDREKLGLKKFWKAYKEAVNSKKTVLIITRKKNVKDLQKDMKLLLRKSIKENGIGAVQGLSLVETAVLLEILQWIFLMALIGTVIFLASKNYKFKIKKDKDGNLEIEGDPK